MSKYLKAAFFISPIIPGIGNVPVNVVALCCLAILGFGNAGFWLLGAGLEVLFLTVLATNPRFQAVVNALDTARNAGDAAVKWQALVQQLPASARKQLADIETRCRRILEIYHTNQVDVFTIDSSHEALMKLTWLYLKLLIARENLQTVGQETNGKALQNEIAVLHQELNEEGITPALLESKKATIDILEKRLENLGNREQALKEIESDLNRIEAQLGLALDNATMSERPGAVSASIDLASHLLDGGFFGDNAYAIADIDQSFQRDTLTARGKQAES